MSEHKEKLKKVDSLIRTAQNYDEYESCQDLYEFLGITNKKATNDEIKAILGNKNKHFQGQQNNTTWGKLAIEFIQARRAIEYVLLDNRSEYDNHLIDCKVKKKLLGDFISRTKRDKKLDSKEKSDLIEEGKEIGLSETKVIDIIDKWLIEYKVDEVSSHSSGSTSDVLLGLTHYEILGVPEDADYDQIKEVYDKEYIKFNNTRDKRKAETRWNRVSDAWECLKDPTKRKEYDKQLKTKRESATSFKNDLVFRSGEKARSLIEASDLIDKYWDEAKEMLNHKDLENWIGANGETVIANDVRVINKTEENKDIALEKAVQAFKLGKKSPEISIHPSLIDMGNLEQGKIIRQSLKVSHAGNRGFLYGEIVKSGGGIRFSHTNILLKPKESVTVDLEIDTSSMPVHKNYKFIIKPNTNAIKNVEAAVSFYISYPASQTRLKFFFYGIGGAGIGIILRGVLAGVGHLDDWLFNYYDYIGLNDKDIDRSIHILPYGVIIPVFLSLVATFYLVYRVIKK